MSRKTFPFIRLVALLATVIVMAVGFPAHARADGTSPGGFASADSGGRSITGTPREDICIARLSGRELFCHRVQPHAQSIDTTPPRGEENSELATGYTSLQPRPAFTCVSTSPAAAPPLRIPRFLFGSFRS